jgi:hypothetical protein
LSYQLENGFLKKTLFLEYAYTISLNENYTSNLSHPF